MATTHEEFFKILKEISAKLNRLSITTISRPPAIVNLSAVVTALNDLNTTLSLLLTAFNLEDFATQTTLDLMKSALDSLEGKDFATQTTLALMKSALDSLEGKDFATQTTLASILTKNTEIDTVLDTIEGKDFFLSGDTTNAGDLLNELESIDQNWNLLSVNNLALLALVDFQEDTRDNTQEIEEELLLQGIEQDKMVADLDAIRIAIQSLDTSITTQQNKTIVYIVEYDVDAIGGGTDVILLIRNASDQSSNVHIRTTYFGAGTNTLQIKVRDVSSSITYHDIQPPAVVTQAMTQHYPDDTATGSPYYTGNHKALVPPAAELFIKYAGVAVNDNIFISVTGSARDATTPTILNTGTTATVTTTTHEGINIV